MHFARIGLICLIILMLIELYLQNALHYQLLQKKVRPLKLALYSEWAFQKTSESERNTSKKFSEGNVRNLLEKEMKWKEENLLSLGVPMELWKHFHPLIFGSSYLADRVT